jgi:branched-subunit amino acid aminotransferase/4-amino-4-deoxychorismate lyase
MDNSKSDIGLTFKNKILETGTSNLLFIKGKKFYSPKKDYYEGNTFKFLKTKVKKVVKKDIFIDELKNYDEILLIGSGKGVASVKEIKKIEWKRKNLNQYKRFSKYYRSAIKKCPMYKF